MPSSPAPSEPLTGVPTLVAYGRLNPFGSPDYVRRRLAERLPDAFAVQHPTAGHNVLAAPWANTQWRNQWVAGDRQQAPPPAATRPLPLEFDLPE